MEKRIIRLPEVKNAVGLSAATIYRRIKAGEFPAQVKLGKHASGWTLSEIEDWIQKQDGHQSDNHTKSEKAFVPTQAFTTFATTAEMIKAPIGTELLRPDEITKITGHMTTHDQVAWLTNNRWQFHTNSKGEVIIGRMYARLKMCGVDLSGN
ncbi:helix-turn-helix transcriptional regulator [Quatrionicoccus australiensis]|uniref:helix-turn-helix transcriptional regulator n=1 Tax=Quatrionicoccus australiensis TaxID=138118 RepID=UPI001CF8B0A5|nr:AlpA family transcriptional regulator [Quatrionicoccus australiensis]